MTEATQGGASAGPSPDDMPRPANTDAVGAAASVGSGMAADAPVAAPPDPASAMALAAMDTEFADVARLHGPVAARAVIDLVGGGAVAFDATVQAVAKDTGVALATLRCLRATFVREKRRAEREITEADKAAARDADGGGAGSAVLLPDRAPWPAPVDGERLVTEGVAFIERQVMVAPGAAVACMMWVILTYVFGLFPHSPRLAITSPLPRCGKTTLLNLLGWMVQRPLSAANLTAAAIFRVIEKWRPTVLMDEADTWLPDNDGARGVLNAGHGRGGRVIRIEGDQNEPKAFDVFSPAAIAMIGNVPATLADRSFKIEMRRKTAAETRARSTRATEQAANELACKAARWALDNATALDGDAEPVMPAGLHDRAADNWRPLFIIAGVMGPGTVKLVWEACEALSGSASDDDDDDANRLPQMLLADMREVMGAADRIATESLLAGLALMDGRPWATFDHGRQITSRGLARLLSGFNIRPKTTRVPGRDDPVKGYQRADCTDAWSRYLPAVTDDIDALMARDAAAEAAAADPGSPF